MKTFTEIKEAIKLCLNSYDYCKKCPYYVKDIEVCTRDLVSDINDIIDEYERLKNENNK